MISIILIEPQEPGNIGAVARAMANFDFESLVLVNPKCDHLCEDARRRSVHATKILEKAKVVKRFSGLKYDYLIATTSVMGTDYNIPRAAIAPKDLAKKISKKNKVGLVFGRESSGLKNSEIDACDFSVTIPTSKKYHSMNLSHAVTILLYEIFQASKKEKITDHINMSTKREKEVLWENFEKVLDQIEFPTKEKKQTQRIVWKKLFSKAMLTKREAFAVIGMLKKIKENKN